MRIIYTLKFKIMNASDKLLLRDILEYIHDVGDQMDAHEHIMSFKKKAKVGIDIIDKSQIRFEFVFEGTEDQFRFFRHAVKTKIPAANMTLDNYTDDGFHCSTQNDSVVAFKTGMIVSACYAHFGHLKDTMFK